MVWIIYVIWEKKLLRDDNCLYLFTSLVELLDNKSVINVRLAFIRECHRHQQKGGEGKCQ